MTLRRILLILPLLAAFAGTAAAQTVTSYDFLRIPVSARAAAMGNTFVTMKNDAAMIFYNPGGISTQEVPGAGIGFTSYIAGTSAGYASYSQGIKDIGWVSAGVIYMNYGEMEKTDQFANKLGTFSPSSMAFSLGYANVYEDLNYGGAAKIIYEGIDTYSSSAIALDLGVMYTLPQENVTFGVAVLNLGAQLDPFVDGGSKEDLPFEMRVGVSHRLKHLPLNIMLNFHKLNEAENTFGNFSVGGEFILSKALRARFGYNAEQRRELKIGNSAGFTGISLGVGIDVSLFTFDYGYNDWGEIGSLHRFGLSARFE